MDGLYMGINIPEVERQKASKALNCDRQCPLWVKSRHCRMSRRCRLYPRKRTLIGDPGMSALCQMRKNLSEQGLGVVPYTSDDISRGVWFCHNQLGAPGHVMAGIGLTSRGDPPRRA
jgi:hypothetical protein